MNPQEEMNRLLAEEKRLVLPRFDAEAAMSLGMEIISQAKAKQVDKICVDVFAYGQQMFHFCSSACAPSNDIWAERKRNTVLFSGHSSLYAHYFLASVGESIQEKWKLDPSRYAQIGGGFPLILDHGGVIGAVTYSGLTHFEDHEMVVNGLTSFLERLKQA